MSKNRQAAITRDMLAIPRMEHLFPFLANGNEPAYFHLVQRLDEKAFWNEISELVTEHRPEEIAVLVRKRFGTGEKRYQWETNRRYGWREQTNSPYVVLEPSQQRKVIDDIIARELKSLKGAEHLLNPPKFVTTAWGCDVKKEPLTRRTQGYLVAVRNKYEITYFRDVGKRRNKFNGMPVYWLVGAEGSILKAPWHKRRGHDNDKERSERRVFINLEREKQRLQFVSEKLQQIQPSCIAAITASYVLFNTEFYIQHYQSELARVKAELAACFSERGIPKVSKQRHRKLLSQEADLEMLIESQRTANAAFEEKVELYWSQEAPKKVWALLSTKRVNKQRVPNEEFKHARTHLRSSARQLFSEGDYLGAMTLFIALGSIGSSGAPLQANGRLPPELQGYRGDSAMAEGQLPDLLSCLEASGMKPYLADGRTVKFSENEAARVELLPEAIGPIHYLRARFFGITPVKMKSVKDDSLAARVERALYHGRL